MRANGMRLTWASADKLRIVLAGMEPDVEVSDLCRREGLNPVRFYAWKKQLVGSAARVFEAKRGRPDALEQRRVAELRRLKDVTAEITAENLDLKKSFVSRICGCVSARGDDRGCVAEPVRPSLALGHLRQSSGKRSAIVPTAASTILRTVRIPRFPTQPLTTRQTARRSMPATQATSATLTPRRPSSRPRRAPTVSLAPPSPTIPRRGCRRRPQWEVRRKWSAPTRPISRLA
jgi:transposase-like protein